MAYPIRTAKLAKKGYDSTFFALGIAEGVEMPAITTSYRSITRSDIAARINAELLDDSACKKLILQLLYPSGPECPHCGEKIKKEITLKNFSSLSRCKCEVCKRWFTATSKTILQNSQLSPREIVLLAVLSEEDERLYSIKMQEKIAQVLKIHPDTVRLWQRKLK